jgi:hypothetical protein
MNPQLLDFIYRTKSKGLDLCLEPTETCTNQSIRAHSIQNSRILDFLVETGKVYHIYSTFNHRHLPQPEFKLVGRAEATNFTGLCGDHDRDLFIPIEVDSIDINAEQHVFLLAYRATLKEYFTVLQEAVRFQSIYQERVRRELDPKDGPSTFGVTATQWLANAYESYEYKRCYDNLLTTKCYSGLRYNTIVLDDQEPAIAVSAMFSMDEISLPDGETPRACVSVIPLDNMRTVVSFACLPEHAPALAQMTDRIFNSSGCLQKYEVSKFLLRQCQNIVISPRHHDKWTVEKRRTILDYFVQTICPNIDPPESPLLYLF